MNTLQEQRLLYALYNDAYKVLPNPITLSSGITTNEYIDCRKALSNPQTLNDAATVILKQLKTEITAIGGLTFGADPLSIATSILSCDLRWFSIRKQQKQHGTRNLLEGYIRPGDKVAILDDVLTTGASLEKAIDAAIANQLEVVQAITLINRSEILTDRLEYVSQVSLDLRDKYPNIQFSHVYHINSFRCIARDGVVL